MRHLLILLLFCFLLGCNNKPAEKTEIPNSSNSDHHTEEIRAVFDAHGGFAKWVQYKTLSYTKADENTVVNLQNRKILISSANQTIGYDGNNVWIAPDTLDASRARFYHNLYFYFYAMPFVVGDPGVYYEKIGSREFFDKTLDGIKVSFGENIGDSPKDYYILWYDPASKKMEWLMYTVTFRTQETSENYSLIRYDDWVELEEGIVLPKKLQWYHFKNDSIGEIRSEVEFSNIKLDTSYPPDSIFMMPPNAIIAQ